MFDYHAGKPETFRLAASLLFLLLLACGDSRAQAEKSPEQTPRFSVTTNLVRLLTSVRDANGAIISQLTKEDFRIFDNDVPQTIALFERNTSLPLSISFLIDTSASTKKDLGYETASILRFLKTLKRAGNAEDAVAIYSFNWQVRLEVGYTRSEERAERALRYLRGEGGTSMYDAVYLVAQDIEDRDGRHVMVIVTDGGDTTSYKKFADALHAAQVADAVLYPVVVVPVENDAGRNLGGEHALDTLARATGGRTFYPSGMRQLDEAFADILRELRTQYLLGYYPRETRAQARGYHPVRVETRDPKLKVSTRSGYYQQ